MSKIRLGGIKALEKHAYLTSLCESGEATLGDICSRLASDRINLSLLTYIADTGRREAITAACTEGTDGYSSYLHWQVSHHECNIGRLLTDVSMVSIFPHNQQPGVMGSLLGVLSRTQIMPHGFASSPSAITTLVSSTDLEALIDGLFDSFELSAYRSPSEWRAACQTQGEQHKEVICAYQEAVIKVYNVVHHSDFDLWHLALSLERLGDFCSVLSTLEELQLKMPFLVAEPAADGETIFFSFCLADAYRDQVRQVLDQDLLDFELSCMGPVSIFFLVGPHFGDRYGIANALVRAMGYAGIPLLALSYAVSSFSLVIQGLDPYRTIEALATSFQIPAWKP